MVLPTPFSTAFIDISSDISDIMVATIVSLSVMCTSSIVIVSIRVIGGAISVIAFSVSVMVVLLF